MALSIPTRDALHDEFITDYSLAQPTKNTSRGSDPYRLGRVVSGAVWSVLAKLKYFEKQMLPDTAEGDWLVRWGRIVGLGSPLAAVGSVGTAALLVTGTVGSVIPVGAMLTHADGTSYQVTASPAGWGPWTIIGGISNHVSVAAVSTGAATNKVAGEILTFSAPPAGINATATLSAALQYGADVESIEAYRSRLLSYIADPPSAGTVADYIRWAKTVSGVKDVYVYKGRRGPGTLDIAIMGTGSGAARYFTNSTAVQTVLDANRPAGAKDAAAIAPIPSYFSVQAQIAIDSTKYKWDWDDAQLGYAITAYDNIAQTLTVPTLPVAVVAGMRIQVNGYESKVVSRAANVLTLDVMPTTFIVGDQVRASGDLVIPAQNAVKAVFDSFGPARYTAGGATYATSFWEDKLRGSRLLTSIEDVPGVTDTIMLVPTTTGTASVLDDPVSTTWMYFLAPGTILITRMAGT
jgi:uncharacterized phage protein gp47/JayE